MKIHTIIRYILLSLAVIALVIGVYKEVHAEICEQALIMKESSNRPLAISFLGAKHGRGLYQISEVALKDYNNYHKWNEYSTPELFIPEKARVVYLWLVNKRIPQLLKHYGHEVTDEAILHVYNIGIGSYNQGKRNEEYVRKYLEFAKSI